MWFIHMKVQLFVSTTSWLSVRELAGLKILRAKSHCFTQFTFISWWFGISARLSRQWKSLTCCSFKMTLPVYPELWQIKTPPISCLMQGWNHGGLLSTSLILIIMVVEALYETLLLAGAKGVSFKEEMTIRIWLLLLLIQTLMLESFHARH